MSKNWKTRTYSKHSDSAGSALKELTGSKPLRNQARTGEGFGRPEVLKDADDDSLQGPTVIAGRARDQHRFGRSPQNY